MAECGTRESVWQGLGAPFRITALYVCLALMRGDHRGGLGPCFLLAFVSAKEKSLATDRLSGLFPAIIVGGAVVATDEGVGDSCSSVAMGAGLVVIRWILRPRHLSGLRV